MYCRLVLKIDHFLRTVNGLQFLAAASRAPAGAPSAHARNRAAPAAHSRRRSPNRRAASGRAGRCAAAASRSPALRQTVPRRALRRGPPEALPQAPARVQGIVREPADGATGSGDAAGSLEAQVFHPARWRLRTTENRRLTVEPVRTGRTLDRPAAGIPMALVASAGIPDVLACQPLPGDEPWRRTREIPPLVLMLRASPRGNATPAQPGAAASRARRR